MGQRRMISVKGSEGMGRGSDLDQTVMVLSHRTRSWAGASVCIDSGRFFATEPGAGQGLRFASTHEDFVPPEQGPGRGFLLVSTQNYLCSPNWHLCWSSY